jgi:hypothetical protein
MMWRELLQTNDETVVAPWVGGRSLRTGERTWAIEGDLPPEHGWYAFRSAGRKARASGPAEAAPGILRHLVRGYLVGDRLVRDDSRVDPDPSKIVRASEWVHLVEPGLDRFARVAAGRACEGGSLVYQGQEMPLGPEGDVLAAYLDDAPSLDHVRGVPPALDAAFRMETWRRAEAERRRAELERLRREEEERLAREERRRELTARLGDAAGRRAMVYVDFADAARAALAIGGAEYLDHRRSVRRGEVVVRFRVAKQRFECTCDEATLRIIDAGICLVDHTTGERGDTYFTLESLPAVILEARRGGKLVVFRHVDD